MRAIIYSLYSLKGPSSTVDLLLFCLVNNSRSSCNKKSLTRPAGGPMHEAKQTNRHAAHRMCTEYPDLTQKLENVRCLRVIRPNVPWCAELTKRLIQRPSSRFRCVCSPPSLFCHLGFPRPHKRCCHMPETCLSHYCLTMLI